MANQVKITIKKVKDLKPEEKRDWKRDYLSRKMAPVSYTHLTLPTKA